MIYCGTENVELIYFHLEDDQNERHLIMMERNADENVFYVRTCCHPEWEWKFAYTTSHYEMVKHAIFDAGFDCEDIDDLLFELDDVFEEYFNEIVIFNECEDNCDCDGGCEHCGCK